MSEATAMNNNPGAKRKRGRPRKHPKADLYHGGAYDVMTDQYMSRGYNSNQQENSGVQSGGISGSHPTQQNPVNDDIMLGQPVHGVIEAVFDAGYLLSVRVGNSETNLKGVVFKPGRYIPVSAENDIAPGVQMIERNKFPIPREDNEHIRRRRYRTREKKSIAHGTHASSTVVSRGGQVLPLMPQTATSGMIPRGNVVPVILQPANVSNGEPSSVAMAPHLMAASKGKAVVDVSVPRSGPSFAQQLAEAEKQVKRQESETMNQQLVPPCAQPQSGLNSNISTAPPASMHIPGMPFEKLLTLVMKSRQELTEYNSSSAGTLSMKDYGLATGDDDYEDDDDDDEEDDDEDNEEEEEDDDDDDDDDSDQPLTVEPLQAIQPNNLNTQPAFIRPHMEYRTGKMTELLQVVQKNVMENQSMQGGKPSE